LTRLLVPARCTPDNTALEPLQDQGTRGQWNCGFSTASNVRHL
jgi:hypothetical protein